MRYFEDNDVLATVCYAILDPATGQLAISSAGHLPPVIAAPGQHGALTQITAERHRRAFPARGHNAGPGARLRAVVLYRRLVERWDESIDDGLSRLRQAVTPGPPQAVCVSAMKALVGNQQPGDDIALVVLHWLPEASTAPAASE